MRNQNLLLVPALHGHAIMEDFVTCPTEHSCTPGGEALPRPQADPDIQTHLTLVLLCFLCTTQVST